MLRRSSLSLPSTRPLRPHLLAAVIGLLLSGGVARAVEVDTGTPDWRLRWDNTLQYNVGVRAQKIEPKIANNPAFNESDTKFKQGDLVTNRLALMSELDGSYQDVAGIRVSGSAWNDFAYSDNVSFQAGNALPAVTAGGTTVAPATPYSALTSYTGGKYSSDTKRFYVRGAQLLDAFGWANFNVGSVATSLKVGRLTQLWGTALIFGAQGIQYSQNAADNIKAAAAPGTLAKELAIPRVQALAQFQILPELTIAGQYFGEFMGNRIPAGGTYLGIVDFLFTGPNQMLGQIPHGKDLEPKDFNNNFGLKLGWSPSLFDGSISAFFRHFDETQPWFLLGVSGAGAPNYHLAYAKGTNAYGLSLETQLAGKSVGLEASYRQKTALNSATGPLPSDLAGNEGARGDTINAVANVLALLSKSPIWDTGQFIAEAAYTHKVKVTTNQDLYNGTGNRLGCPTGSKWDGCSTDDAVGLALLFTPQWLSVFPGVDLDLPLFAMYGLYGNAASLGVPVGQGAIAYTVGVHALYHRKYNLTVQYNGYYAPTHGGLTDFTVPSSASLPAGLSFAGAGPQYYASGNGAYMYNDRGWFSLTFSTTL